MLPSENAINVIKTYSQFSAKLLKHSENINEHNKKKLLVLFYMFS